MKEKFNNKLGSELKKRGNLRHEGVRTCTKKASSIVAKQITAEIEG